MAKVLHCDVCKRPTEEIVGKIFLTPLGPGRSANGFHVNYSHHADVGVCCFDRLLGLIAFQKRKTAKEYHQSRRKGVKSGGTVEKAKSTPVRQSRTGGS